MRVYRAISVIDAPVERVWDTLVDFPAYGAWNPFTPKIETQLVVGEPVDITVRLGARRPILQRERSFAIEPPHRLSWGMSLRPHCLLHAERTQTLEALPDGRTRYETVDAIGGWLSGVVERIYGDDLRLGFGAMAKALKDRVEADRAPVWSKTPP